MTSVASYEEKERLPLHLKGKERERERERGVDLSVMEARKKRGCRPIKWGLCQLWVKIGWYLNFLTLLYWYLHILGA